MDQRIDDKTFEYRLVGKVLGSSDYDLLEYEVQGVEILTIKVKFNNNSFRLTKRFKE